MKPFVGCAGLTMLLAACGDTPTVQSASATQAPHFALQPVSGTTSSDVIRACVNSSSGEMKVLTAGAECAKHEVLLQWNVVGPAGPAGPSGPPGPVGPAGPTNVQVYFAQASGVSARVFCPVGTRVVGGGALSTSANDALSQSFPIDPTGGNASGSDAAGWQAATVNFAGTVQAFVLCASS
jgi:hypothetical protein